MFAYLPFSTKKIMKCYVLFMATLLGVSSSLSQPTPCPSDVCIDWATIIAVSKTTTTLQVVANPILNLKTCPVAAAAWQSLVDLNASYVRFCPWYPYPSSGVAELRPPNMTSKTTSSSLQLKSCPAWLWVYTNQSFAILFHYIH